MASRPRIHVAFLDMPISRMIFSTVYLFFSFENKAFFSLSSLFGMHIGLETNFTLHESFFFFFLLLVRHPRVMKAFSEVFHISNCGDTYANP